MTRLPPEVFVKTSPLSVICHQQPIKSHFLIRAGVNQRIYRGDAAAVWREKLNPLVVTRFLLFLSLRLVCIHVLRSCSLTHSSALHYWAAVNALKFWCLGSFCSQTEDKLERRVFLFFIIIIFFFWTTENLSSLQSNCCVVSINIPFFFLIFLFSKKKKNCSLCVYSC